LLRSTNRATNPGSGRKDRRLTRRAIRFERGATLKDHQIAVESRLDRFVAGVPGVIEAFAVGAEGLLIASSAGVDRARADTVAAIGANLHSLTAAFAKLLPAGRVGATMIETSGGFMFLLGLADDSVVIGWADRTCDVGQIGFELAALAESLS
jgi:uncharacterized protein